MNDLFKLGLIAVTAGAATPVVVTSIIKQINKSENFDKQELFNGAVIIASCLALGALMGVITNIKQDVEVLKEIVGE